MSVYFRPYERERREEFIFVSNAHFCGWKVKTNNNNKRTRRQERVNTERERERVTNESSRFFLAMMATPSGMNSWRAECARVNFWLPRVKPSWSAEPKRKKNAQISLSLSPVFSFFFLLSRIITHLKKRKMLVKAIDYFESISFPRVMQWNATVRSPKPRTAPKSGDVWRRSRTRR